MHDFTRAPGSISRPIGSTGRHPSFETGYSIAPSIAALYKFPPLDYHHYALLVRAMHLLLVHHNEIDVSYVLSFQSCMVTVQSMLICMYICI